MKKTVIKPDLQETRKRDFSQEVTILYDDILVPILVKEHAKDAKYAIYTFGCQANIRDQETIEGLLIKAGYGKTEQIEEASLIILNTCAVRENAEQKVFGKLGDLKGLKEKKKDLVVAVCGCMIGEPKIVDTIIEKYHQVDLMFGTNEINNLLKYLAEVYQRRKLVLAANSSKNEIFESLPSIRLSSFKAFVNIMYGCDKFCTYCIVPYTRGQQRSRKSKDILQECQELHDQGYQEITLLGQNVNAYGKDLKSDLSFGQLLQEVCKIGIPRVRFLTSHPWDFDDEIIKAYQTYSNLMPYLHLPVQSGSTNILRLMGRRYSKEEYLDLIKKIRNKIPDLAISTDIIVGFPNESEDDFNETLDVVKQAAFESAFTFIYSPRDGTPAARLKDNVSYQVKSDRFTRLVKEINAIIEKKNRKYLNQVVEVLVDNVSKKDKNKLSGYSKDNKLVHFNGSVELIGKIVKVHILTTHVHYLNGELLGAQD